MPVSSDELIQACRDVPDAGHWEPLLAALPLEERQDLLGTVIAAWSKDPLNLSRGGREMADLLMRQGANPLVGCPSLFRTAIDETRVDVAVHLVNLLCQAQALHGISHRDDRGGNVLHVLVDTDPEWLGNLFESAFNKTRLRINPTQTMSLPQFAYFHQAWLNEPRDDGATPLHVWWHEAPEIYYYYGRDSLAGFHVWDRFIYLARAGASMEAVDHAGVSVAALMVQAVDQHGVDGMRGAEWMDQARAIAQAQALQSDTLSPAPTRASGPRL